MVGSGEVPFNAAVYNKAKERWIPMVDEEGQQGEVHIVLQVVPKGYKADLENIATSVSRLTLVPEVIEGHGQLVIEGTSAFRKFISDSLQLLKLQIFQQKM